MLYTTYMKQFFILLFFLPFSLSTLSQTKKIKIEKYASSNDITSSEILLCSDSTFFLALYGCVGNGVSKGRWLKLKNKISLKCFPRSETGLNVSIAPQRFVKDSFLTFKFQDLFLTPLTKNTILFFDKNFSVTRLTTNSEGIIKCKPGEYIAFLTQIEEQNLDSSDHIKNKIHFLDDKISSYQVTINYPSSFFEDETNTFFYQCPNSIFLLQKNKLIDTKIGMIYKKNKATYNMGFRN